MTHSLGIFELFFSEICNENELLSFETFKNIVDHTLETHAPLKRRYERANQSPFINRKISKDIMKRSRLTLHKK